MFIEFCIELLWIFFLEKPLILFFTKKLIHFLINVVKYSKKNYECQSIYGINKRILNNME